MPASTQLSSSRLAVAAVVANLVCCVALGGIWSAIQHSGTPGGDPLVAGSAQPSETETTTPYPPDTATETAPESPTDSPTGSSSETTSSPAVPDGMQQVGGPGGMETILPTGWQTTTLSEPGSEQATDPQDSRRIIKFGGAAPTDNTDIYSYHVTYEQQIAQRPGYVRDTLQQTTVRGNDAVDWEFEWDAPEGRRHVLVTYWRAGGIEYYVYVHSPEPVWSQTAQLEQEMVENSTP